MLKKFLKLQTSKKLITIVVLVWVLSIIIGYIGTFFGISFIDIIQIVNLDFLVILGFYFTKAGSENIVKITKDFTMKKKEPEYDELNEYDEVPYK